MSVTSARRKSTAVSLVLILSVMAAVAVSDELTDNDKLPEEGNERVVSVESYDTGGNMGYGEMIEVHLSNGTQLNYQKYTNNDPRCSGMPEGQINETRCEDYGETSKDDGFDEARQFVDEISEDVEPENTCFYPKTGDIFRDCLTIAYKKIPED